MFAAATDDVTDSVAALRNSLLVALPLTVAALAMTIWFVVGRALRPVQEIRQEVDAITETDLGRRVPVPASGDEIERLAATMNSMLDRLECGVTRLQSFVADSSHELRSPLTRIRSELEVDLANPDRADLASTHASVLDEAVAMEQLVFNIYTWPEDDAGRAATDAAWAQVSCRRHCVHRGGATTRAQGHENRCFRRLGQLQVMGDHAQLRRLVRNLASNAHRFAASTVSFSVGEEGDAVSSRGH